LIENMVNRRRDMNLRRPSVLNHVIKKYGSHRNVTSSSLDDTNEHMVDIDINEIYAKPILIRLAMNDERFDKLELGIEMLRGCDFSELIRALSLNDHLKHIIIKSEFLAGVCNERKEHSSRMLMELVGRLPNLTEIKIEFPDFIIGSAASLLCHTIQYANNLESLEVSGLRLVSQGEEEELEKAFNKVQNLKKMRLIDFVVWEDIDADPFLEEVARLPLLFELEIRMKDKMNMHGMFFEALCDSKSLVSLIFWNMVLDMVQVTHILETITKSNHIKRFELWRCDFGPMFGVLLTDVIRNNKSLETLVISHVEFHGSGILSLLNALKRKDDCKIQGLRLLNLCNSDQKTETSNITRSAISMIEKKQEHHSLTRVSISFDELSDDDCINLDKQLRENIILREHREEVLAKRSKWKTNFEILFGITSRY